MMGIAGRCLAISGWHRDRDPVVMIVSETEGGIGSAREGWDPSSSLVVYSCLK
jgi:hypothetical protein